MNGAREEMLMRIRAAQQSVIAGPIPREYRRSGSLSTEQRLELFIDRLIDYNALVHRVEAPGIAQVIGEVLRGRKKNGLLVPAGIRQEWLPNGFVFVRDEDRSYSEIDESEGVLTACAVAIALTGTIVLRHSTAEGRRSLTLIPDYHLCVVFEDQVVETVPEGLDRMAQFRTDPITTIAGPSATSDIEMTRVNGVHGPRTLEVILAAR